MKTCLKCGHYVADNEVNCRHCGASVEAEKSSETSGKRPFMYYMISNKRLSRALTYAYISIVLGLLVSAYLCNFLHTDGIFTIVSPHWAIAIGAGITACAALVGYYLPVRTASASELRDAILKNPTKKEHNNALLGRIIVFWGLSLLSIVPLIISSVKDGLTLRGYYAAASYYLAVCVLYIFAERIVARRNAAMINYLWGCKSPTTLTPFAVDYDEKRELSAYSEYMRTPERVRHQNDDAETNKRILKRRIAIGTIGAMFVVLSAVVVAISTIVTDKFSAGYANISVIAKEADLDKLRMLYGDINFIRQSGDGWVIEYYSDCYLDLYEEYYDLSKELEKAQPSAAMFITSQMEALRLKMAAVEYKYLAVYINGNYYEQRGNEEKNSYNYLEDDEVGHLKGDVVQIVLDASRFDKLSTPKKAQEVTAFVPVMSTNQISTEVFVEVEIRYADGSYFWRKSALPQLDTSQLGSQSVNFTDPWGGVHNISVNIL